MWTPRLQGRDFGRHDTAGSPAVAIVNDRFVREFFGPTSPIGQRVTSLDVGYEIVGVVADALYEDIRHGVEPTMYIPWTQRGDPRPTNYRYLVRVATSGSLNLGAALERAVVETDPVLRVRDILPYSTIIDRSLPAERILATLGGLFGALAVAVAATGIFALLAFQVARRTNELGVRMILGATRSAVVRLVLKDVVWMLVCGVALGGMTAMMLTELAREWFFGLTPTDARVYALAAGVLTSAALAAAWVPARRAARVDPLTALSQD
jgi:hypothetical protein